MLKTYLVARREFLATVLTKGFLLGIILPPAIAAIGITLLPLLMNQAAPKTVGVIAVIDQSEGGRMGETLKRTITPESFKSKRAKKMEEDAAKTMNAKGLNLPNDDRSKKAGMAMMAGPDAALTVEVLPVDTKVESAQEPIKKTRVRDHGESSSTQRVALLVIPPDAVRGSQPKEPPNAKTNPDRPSLEFGHYQLYTAPKLDIEVQQDIAREADLAIVDARMAAANFDPALVRTLSQEPQTDYQVVTEDGVRKDTGIAAIFLPIGFLLLLWISVLVGGQGLLMSTIEEKSSRVMEVLLSAVSPIELMVGKIIGQMGVASLILALYSFTGVGALVFFSMNHLLDPMLLVWTAVYFVIAFFLMASMMAAIGSVVNDIREAQSLMQPVMLVMIIPMVLWMPISRNPNGPFALACSFLPPISPFVMVVRLAGSEPIPMWQVPATILLGLASMAFMAWATAKIFRIGVLMYGKPPNLKTLVRWVRMA